MTVAHNTATEAALQKPALLMPAKAVVNMAHKAVQMAVAERVLAANLAIRTAVKQAANTELIHVQTVVAAPELVAPHALRPVTKRDVATAPILVQTVAEVQELVVLLAHL